MASEAELHEAMARKCREAIVSDVWAYFRIVQKGEETRFASLSTLGKNLREGPMSLADEGYGSLAAAKALGVRDEMPEMRGLFEKLQEAVEAWTEEELGRSLTEAERQVWAAAAAGRR